MYKSNILRGIMEFLSAEYKEEASLGNLNICRSAIMLLHGPELDKDALFE